jgi:hypothetical protein
MASLQIHQRRVHAFIEAVQDERGSGEGAIETPGAGAEIGSGGCDPNSEVVVAVGAASKDCPGVADWKCTVLNRRDFRRTIHSLLTWSYLRPHGLRHPLT